MIKRPFKPFHKSISTNSQDPPAPKRPYREHHIISLLEAYEKQHLPLDLFVSMYFKQNKALGPKDRGAIAEAIYGIIRWKGLIDHICGPNPTWASRLETFSRVSLKSYSDESLPKHILYSFPQCLYDLIVKSHGEGGAAELCLCSNGVAPTTIRINPAKITRDAMIALFKDRFPVSRCTKSEYGIVFLKKLNFFSLPEFQQGLFEVQDEGSQLLSTLVAVKPGQQVMDYCSGSGGKTLAFAHRMEGKGQIFLHDIRPYALMDAKKRLRRAGVQNSQIIQADDEAKLKKLKKKMDWVLVDAPCTGTGTMRRNPDMKWKFTEETLPRLIGQQRTIFEKALSFLKPDGRIVYCTCSILKEENEEQVAHFIKTYDLKMVREPFHSLTLEGQMDGFYGVVLTK